MRETKCFALHCFTLRVMCKRSDKGDLPPRVSASTGIKLLLKIELHVMLNILQRIALQLPVVKQIGGFMNLEILFEW